MTRLVQMLQRTSRVAAALVVLGGSVVLLGWQLQLRSLQAVGPVDVVMNPLAALLFMITGVLLLVGERDDARGFARAWPMVLGAIVALCGAAVLGRSVFGWPVGVDELLFGDQVRAAEPTDWMAANTALCFLLLGLALVTRRVRSPSGRVPAHWLALPVALMSLLVVIGYLFGASDFVTFQLALPMALNTALFFLAACLALVAARPHEGALAMLVGDNAGGSITRHHLPSLLVVPLVMGGVINVGMLAGWYDPTVGLALLTLAMIVLSVLLTITTAGALNRSEAALRHSEEHFRALVENASDYVMIVDRQGFIRYVSPSIQGALGYDPTAMLGCTPETLIHPEDTASVRDALRETFRNPGQVVRSEFRIRHQDGSWRVVENVGRTLRADSGDAGAVANARDVTDRKAVEVALQEAKEEAERANRAKSEFLSRMSHELRTPMNAILGFAQLLERQGVEPEQEKHLGHILGGGKHLLGLINEVLDLARIESGQLELSLEPVAMNQVVREAMDLVRPLATGLDNELVHEASGGAELFAAADRQRLSQVLINLLSNAIKYNRPGGQVRVRVEKAASGIVVCVKDHGRGIPDGKRHELFTPFARLGAEQSETEGTGLGLALSLRLAEAMNGRLVLEETGPEGTTFRLELAAASDPMLAPRIVAVATDGKAPGTEAPATILYIEDNLANLSLVEAVLESRPSWKTISALRGAAGIELAREKKPDVILLDLNLPGMPGIEVLARLRADPATADIPVIVISADATDDSQIRLRAAGASDYLTKPIDIDRFLEVVERYVTAQPIVR